MGSGWETHVREVPRMCAKLEALKLLWWLSVVGLPNFNWHNHKLGRKVGQNVGQDRKSWAGKVLND